MIKKLERLLTVVASVVLGLYAAIVLLFSLPAMQEYLAGWTASILSQKISSKVEIASVNIGFLNRVILNDITIYEPSGKKMASIARASASVNIAAMLSGEIAINTAQLFSGNIILYKETPDSAPNFQFLIDAFKSDDKKEPSKIDLSIGSLIVRRTSVSYDVLSEAKKERGLDVNHLSLRGVAMNLALGFVTDESLAVKVKRLQASELNSGLQLVNSNIELSIDNKVANVANFHIEMPNSKLEISPFRVNFPLYESKKEFSVSKTKLTATLSPLDFATFLPKASTVDNVVNVTATLEGNHNQFSIIDFLFSVDGVAELSADSKIASPLRDDRKVDLTINYLRLQSKGANDVAKAFDVDSTMLKRIDAIGNLVYSGKVTIENQLDENQHTVLNDIQSNGKLISEAGNIDYTLAVNPQKVLNCTVIGDNVNLGGIAGIKDLGVAQFDIKAKSDLSNKVANSLPLSHVEGDIHSIEYKEYQYKNIHFYADNNTNTTAKGQINIEDENLKLKSDFDVLVDKTQRFVLSLNLGKCVPSNLKLTNANYESFTCDADVHLQGSNLNNLYGNVTVSDFTLSTPTDSYIIDRFDITAEHESGTSFYNIDSDFIEANIEGQVKPTELPSAFTNILSHHLPQLFKQTAKMPHASFDYSLTLNDCDLLRYLTKVNYNIKKPITAYGHLDAQDNDFALNLHAPAVEYGGTMYNNVKLLCNSSMESMHTELTGSSIKYDEEGNSDKMNINLLAETSQGVTKGDIVMSLIGDNNIKFNLFPIITLTDSLGKLNTRISMENSSVNINDTLWTIMPTTISIHEKNIACNGLKCVSNTGSSLLIDGSVSSNPEDSIVAQLSDVEIKYILDAVNFDAVRFAGKASGNVTVKGLMNKGTNPDLKAHLNVKNFTLQEGSFGDADIVAEWNKESESIDLKADFVDHFKVPVDLSTLTEDVTGHTSLTGWISPSKNDMRLDIMTDNTNANFLHGFLKGVFTEVNGTLSGPVSVVGLSPVNLIGRAAADISIRLRSTDVPYHIPGDTVYLSTDLINIPKATLLDRFGNRGKLNATVSHHNLKNFSYSFHADMDGLCAYEETEFNSDKFLATVFANGTLDINGADGHPLRLNADITPAKGSVFAYDAATPDAIIGNSFVEFADRDSVSMVKLDYKKEDGERLADIKPISDFRTDIYFNANIHLTPDCEVKLRMDNIEDGYMRTFGYANFNAQWHNKGSFQLFGNYNIESGSYRLYLQNLIFRDLALQKGSSVEFNGNPFDASIHLVCHHTVNSVPLSDLTSTKAFSQNNKAKVNCILDISGYLEKMDFKFDMELPNVSDEARQLVRSMINSEEEMNTQMIYLLGFGRFYPSEYVREVDENASNQAMNSLLSSTLSGQINQLLSNMIGQNSNWTFGSSLRTGENGWEDLDVEGMLSGRLFNERLLVNGNFGYRDNALTNQASFIGDFEVKYKLLEKGNLYIKAYNQANDRYFTKATLNTQGVGFSWQHDFDNLFPRKKSILIPSRKE